MYIDLVIKAFLSFWWLYYILMNMLFTIDYVNTLRVRTDLIPRKTKKKNLNIGRRMRLKILLCRIFLMVT